MQRPCFLFGAKGASAGMEYRHQTKVAILVQRDNDQKDDKMDVSMEPKTTSPPEPLVGEDHH